MFDLATTLLYIGVRIGAWLPNVDGWETAAAMERAGPRIRRTDAEVQLEQDYQAIADRVLSAGELDDPRGLETRVTEAFSVLLG